MIDKSIHVPPDYYTFVPPMAGRVFKDPAFGSLIRRVSAARRTPDNATGGGKRLDFIATEYSTVSPFNCDNTRMLLVHQSYFGLYGPKGHYLKDLPFEVSASTEPRWSRLEPSVLYFVTGNELRLLDVESGRSELVRAFPEYQRISGKGESDISQDGDYFVFAGDDREVFVYRIGMDLKGAVLQTDGRSFDSLYLTPDGNVTVTWNVTGSQRFQGIELFDRDMHFKRQVTHAGGHMDMTRDTNGDEVLVWTNSNDPDPIADCDNAIVKVRLADGHQTCLLKLDWSQAVHISCPDGNGWCFVETYGGDPSPNTQAWKPYTAEILQVSLDGSDVRRLLHHRSRPSNNYGYMPKVTCSRDGSKLAFTSNYGMPVNHGWPADYTDAYMLTVSL